MSASLGSMLGAVKSRMAYESRYINSDDHDLRHNNVRRGGQSRSHKCCRCFWPRR